MNNIFRLHLFGVIYWSEADIFLILVYLGKVNRYKWTFLNIFRAGARGARRDGLLMVGEIVFSILKC